MSISVVLVTFLLQMCVGMLFSICFLPARLVDRLFFKSICFWSWFFTAIALFFAYKAQFHMPQLQSTDPSLTTGIAASAALWKKNHLSFLVFGILCFQLWFRIYYRDTEVKKVELLLITIVGLIALALEGLIFRMPFPPLWAQNILIPLHFISSGAILGGFLAGMLFGHHYLMNTELPKKLLLTMAWTLIGIMAFRVFSVLATLFIYKSFVFPNSNFLQILTSFQGHGIFFWQRVLVGLLIPSIVVFMIWGTARIGSNQSSTGIMYAAIAFVFIGELAARYLFILSGIPL